MTEKTEVEAPAPTQEGRRMSDVVEKAPGDAPIWLDADEANAWADGYNAAAHETAAEITALRDKLATATKERDEARGERDRTDNMLLAMERHAREAMAKTAAATAESDRLRRALEFYADKNRWFRTTHRPECPGPSENIVFFSDNPWASTDMEPWRIATQALKEQTP